MIDDAAARAKAAKSHLASWYGEFIGADSPRYQEVDALISDVLALVARVTDLEAKNEKLSALIMEQEADYRERARAAEAQVAVLTSEREVYTRSFRERYRRRANWWGRLLLWLLRKTT